MKGGQQHEHAATHNEAAAASSSSAAAPPLPPLHPSAHSPSLTAMQQLLSIATEASKQQNTHEHETHMDAAAAASDDAAAASADSCAFEAAAAGRKRARNTQQSNKRAHKAKAEGNANSIEEGSSALAAASSSAAADSAGGSASDDHRLSRMRRSYRQQVLAHQQELLKVDNITGALREVSKLAKEAQREAAAAATKARSKRGAAAAAASSSKDAEAPNSNSQVEATLSSSSSAAATTVPSDAPDLKDEPAAAAAAGADPAHSSPQLFWTRSQQRAILQKIESLSNKALAEADAQLHAVSGRQLRARKPKEPKKEEADDGDEDDEEEEEEEEEEPEADDDDEEEIPEEEDEEDPSDFEDELFSRRVAPAPARKQAATTKARVPPRPVAKKVQPKSAKPSRTLVNSDIDQRPVYIHYVYTHLQYTLSIDEARAITAAKRAEKVVLPVRWLCTAKRSRKNGPGAAPTMADLFVVAKDIATLIHKRRGSIAKAIALFNPRTEKGRVRVYGCRSPGKPGTQLLTVLSMLGVQKLMQSSKYKYSKRVRQWTMDWAKALLKAIPIKESGAAAPADTPPAVKHLAALVFKNKITPAEVEVLTQSAFDKLKLTFGGKPILPETVVEEGAEGDMEEELEDDEIGNEDVQQEAEDGADTAMLDEEAAAGAQESAGLESDAEIDLNAMFPDGIGDDENLMVDDELPWMQLQRSDKETEPAAAAAAAAPSASRRARSSPSPVRQSASPPRKVTPVKSKQKSSRLAPTEPASSSSSAAAAAGAPDHAEAELVQSLMDRTSNDRRNEKRREKAKQKREEARAAAAAAATISSSASAAAKSPSPPAPKKRRTHSPAMAAAAASLSRASHSPSPPAAKVSSSRNQAAPPIPKRVKRESLGTTQVSPARPMLDVRSQPQLCTPESTPRLTPLTVSASSSSTHATPPFALSSQSQHTPVFGAGSTPQSRDITPLSSRQSSPMPLFSGMQPVKRHLRMSSNPAGMVDLTALEVAAGAVGTGSGFSPKGIAAGSTAVSANPQLPQHSMAMTTMYHPSSMMYSQYSNFMQQPQQMLFHSSFPPPHVLSPVGGPQQSTAMLSPAHGHSKSVQLPTPSHSLMMHSHSQSHGGAFTFGSSLSPRGTNFNPNAFMQPQSFGTQPLSHLRGGMVSSAAPMFASGFPNAQAQQAHHALNQHLAAHLKDASAAAMPMVTQATAVTLEQAPVMATATTPPEVTPAAAASSSLTPSPAHAAVPLTDQRH